MARIREGYCDVTNPFNAKQVSRVSLLPADVDAVVFWSKYPAPLLAYLDELEQRGYRCGFLVTVNDYPVEIEPGVPPLAERLATVRTLAERVGVPAVVWRYDPILLSVRMPAEWHAERFSALAAALAPHVDHAIVSFADFYRKTERRLRRVEGATGDRMWRDAFEAPGVQSLVEGIMGSAAGLGLTVQSCAEDPRLESMGIVPGGCIDAGWVARFAQVPVSPAKDTGQREWCRCARAKDIGHVNTCTVGCRYCYATDGRLPDA